MKKLYIISWNGTSNAGGVERVVKYICDICTMKREVVIVCDELLNKSSFWSRFICQNSILKSLGYSLWIYFHKKKNDYVISNGYQASFVRADYLWIHGNMMELQKCVEDRVYYQWTKSSILEFFAAHTAKKIVSVAEHAKREYERLYHVPSRKIVVLPNPVDPNFFYPDEKQFINDETIRILFVGRIEKRKGEKDLVKLASYIEEKAGYKLIIVTQSKEKKQLFRNKRNTEIFLNVQFDELNRYYNMADVFYFPSKYEGYEMVTLESLSAGVPVVGYRVGAISDLSEKGFDGVRVIEKENKPIETTILAITEMAKKYKNIDKKQRLHNEVEKSFGLNAWTKKINKKTKLL